MIEDYMFGMITSYVIVAYYIMIYGEISFIALLGMVLATTSFFIVLRLGARIYCYFSNKIPKNIQRSKK